MDNYFYSKIAFGLLLSGVLGFFFGAWWAWSVFGSWRRRAGDAHQRAILDLEEQIAESGRRLNDEKARWAEAQATAEASEAKARAMEARLRAMEEASKGQARSAEAELLAARDLLAALQPRLEERDAEVSQLRGELDAIRQAAPGAAGGPETDAGAAELQAARDLAASVQARLEEKDAELSRLRAELDAALAQQTAAAQVRLEEHESEARALRHQLEEALAQHASSAAMASDAAARLDALQIRMDEKEAEAANLRAQLDSLLAARSEPVSPEPEASHEDLKKRFDGVVTEKDRTISELLSRIDSLSGAEAKLEDARARQAALEEQVSDYRQTIDTWESHVNALTRDQSAKLEQAEQDNARLRAEVSALQASLSERSDSISRLEADAALLSHVRQSMRERQTRIDGLKLQLDQCRESLHKTEEELGEVKRFAEAGRDQQARERDAEIARLREELDAVRANLSERNDAISRLEADAALLSHVRQGMRERQTRIDGLKLQLDQAREALAHAHAGLPQEAEIAHLKEDVAALRTRLSERNEAISRLEADAALLSHVRQSMRERQTRIDGLTLQLEQARADLHKTGEELATLKQFVAAGRDAQARERDAEIDRLNTAVQSLEGRLSERNEAISRLEADAALLSHVRQSMRERQTRIDGLTLQLANARKELAASAASGGGPDLDRLRADLRDRDEQLSAWEHRYEASIGELQERIRELESTALPAAAAVSSPSGEVQARLRLAAMRGVQFRPDSDEIDPASIGVLEEAAGALQLLGGSTHVEIAGHTDSWGDDMSNLMLSERRARAVCDFLVARGVDGARLSTKGYGGSRPIADNLTADGRYANRRIEFVVRG